jgi:hypothetical protein
MEITPQSISEMLRWPLNLDNEMLNEIILDKCFRELNPRIEFPYYSHIYARILMFLQMMLLLNLACLLKF